MDCVWSTTTRSPSITDAIDSIISVVLRWKDNFTTDEIQDVRGEDSTDVDPLYSEHEMHHHEVDGFQLMSLCQTTQKLCRSLP